MQNKQLSNDVNQVEEFRSRIVSQGDTPTRKYNIIYADPAWPYNLRKNGRGKGGGMGAQGHYPVMKVEDICALPIQEIAADDCMLFLWATPPRIKLAFEVIDAWGFEYKTFAFTWMKQNKINGELFMGTGYYTRANAEPCLLATKGKPKRVSNNIYSALLSPIEVHSKKPDIIRDRIVRLCGDKPRIELFARQKADGWDCWGNEVTSSQPRIIDTSCDVLPPRSLVMRSAFQRARRSTA